MVKTKSFDFSKNSYLIEFIEIIKKSHQTTKRKKKEEEWKKQKINKIGFRPPQMVAEILSESD